ncbi:MAG: hypothetical protein OSB47_09565 [Pirellulaceae bacterium]|nr:hypothetical protein [Pirellulaceae bacterium]
MVHSWFKSLLIFLLAVVLVSSETLVRACPFCSAVSQTFSEEMASMDAVVLGKLMKLPPAPKPGEPKSEEEEVPKALFEVVTVLKGQALMGKTQTIETIYFGEGKVGSSFLIMGVDPPKLMWSTPLQMTKRAQDYIVKLPGLPAEGSKRLEFFQEYLEDKDEMLARDAYDEFAKSPYAAVKQLKTRMKHDQVIAWIKDVDVPASRRRLYLTMLGVCGTDQDLPLLETMLRSQDRKMKAGLDAMIACYLTLKGESGVTLVEELFLKNKKSEYADTYAAIMALRFHGTEADIVPKKRLLKALHYMLERPQLADLVIPDLARWEDWSQMDRLVKLFKDADDKTSWVRVPVINYLRACPLPVAKERIKELEKVDPAAVKRANTFFPFGPGAKPGKTEATTPEKSSQQDRNDSTEKAVVASDTVPESVPVGLDPADENNGIAQVTEAVAAATSPDVRVQSPEVVREPMNRWFLLGVPWVVGVGLFLMQWVVLNGAGRGSIEAVDP